jgi:electron transfer flavoprotein alpha subunit
MSRGTLGLDAHQAVAVIVARGGRLPGGADEAVAEAGGRVVVVGSQAEQAATRLTAATHAWWCDTGVGLRPGTLAARLCPLLVSVPLVVLPASPDGRDLAPRLAALLDRPLIAHAVSLWLRSGPVTDAQVSRLDDRVLISMSVDGPVVATLVSGSRTVTASKMATVLDALDLPVLEVNVADVDVLDVVEPDPATMDLSDAVRVLGGGAGLAAGQSDSESRAMFDLLASVSTVLGASSGATRVATDAGWTGYERQIGTTGVTIDPDLYVAFGVSGAAQHIGGIGAPRHIVSVNTDSSCPMTGMADLGLITDARGLLKELARRFGLGSSDSDPDTDTDVERERTHHA